jgi:hypothetical protein
MVLLSLYIEPLQPILYTGSFLFPFFFFSLPPSEEVLVVQLHQQKISLKRESVDTQKTMLKISIKSTSHVHSSDLGTI